MKEPFLMNPHLGIINPRRKKGKKSMAKRRSSKAHMAYVRSFRKNSGKKRAPARRRARRTRRRNPWPAAGLVMANPRRRRSRRNRAVSHRRRRHSYSRNPSIMGIQLPPLNKVLFAGVGFVAPPMLEGVIAGFIPAEITSSTIGKYAVKIASVLAVAFGIRRFIGREQGNMAAIGGGVYVLSSAAMEFLPNLFGHGSPTQISMYRPTTGQLMAYVPANQRVNNNLGLPSAAFSNVESSGAQGGTASRFKRF